MAEVTYTSVVWTAGDIITEAKMDNMVANDRAVDAMNNGVEFTERATPSTPAANKVHLYAKDKSGVPTLYAINDAATDFEVSERHSTFVFTYPDVLSTGVSVVPLLVATRALTIVKAYANVKTAPTGVVGTPIAGKSLVLDLNKNGSTLWSTQSDRLSITDGATSGSQTAFNTTSLVEGDTLALDIDYVGSTLAGADLTVELKVK